MSENLETQALKQAVNQLNIIEWPYEILGVTAATVGQLEFGKALKKFPKTEKRGAEIIQKKFKNYLSYNAATDVWYFWNGRIHKPTESHVLVRQIVEIFHEALSGAMDLIDDLAESLVAQSPDNEKTAKRKELRGKTSEHRYLRDSIARSGGITSMVKMLETHVNIPGDYFANDTRWFVVQNGVFDMDDVRKTREWKLLPHDGSRPVYREWKFKYNPGSTHEHLDHFLETSIEDESQARFLQKILGTAVFGTRPDEGTRSFVSIQGKPRSGKSMILRVLNAFCEENTFVREPQVSAIIQRGKNPEHGRNPMKEARIAAFTEVTERLERMFMLKFSGGDKCTSEDKYIKNSSWYPQGVIFLFSNHGANIDKTDKATYDRLKPINFPHQFELPPFDDGVHTLDPQLQDKIVSQGSGFLEWLMEGFIRGLEEDFYCSESMERLKQGERDEQDEVGIYLADRIEKKYYSVEPGIPSYRYASLTTAYTDYKLWHGQNGSGHPASRSQFRDRLAQYYPFEPIDAVGKKKTFTGLVYLNELERNMN